ncbi:hypothetical protein [Paenibacillus ehimensis]|uniref:hypothetical protein n=1 Tax=Paenibacillus ehimensis TaxID=79264 RepID=UPI0013E37D8A|nr:hypothetical protein [Paenibacillus ehimensis]
MKHSKLYHSRIVQQQNNTFVVEGAVYVPLASVEHTEFFGWGLAVRTGLRGSPK